MMYGYDFGFMGVLMVRFWVFVIAGLVWLGRAVAWWTRLAGSNGWMTPTMMGSGSLGLMGNGMMGNGIMGGGMMGNGMMGNGVMGGGMGDGVMGFGTSGP